MEDVMAIQRQTNLTLEEISELLDSNAPGYPRCLLLNELGILAENDKTAEAKLRGFIFTEENPNGKCATYGFLSRIKEPDAETTEAINQFKADPQNAEIVTFADRMNKNLG